MNVVFSPAAPHAGRGKPMEFICRRDKHDGMRLGMIQFSPATKGWRARAFTALGVVTLGGHCRTSLDAALYLAAHHEPGVSHNVTYIASANGLGKPRENGGTL